MKSIKLLAALAIPAMFAACTNEEIAMESTQQLNQVVGAELIGTDISINVSNGVGSRLNAEGWQSTDKLGLAWIVNIVNEDYLTPQDIENAPSSDKWFANHMFAVEDGKFVTKGNAYKGWHFAYFPFSYTESVSDKVFNINPAQTSKEWLGGRINDALHISSLKFLTRESLDENYQLKEDIKFVPQRAVNAIQVTTTATEGFAEGGALADLDVNSITLKVQSGFNVFADKVNMKVQYLPLDTAKVAISKDSLYKHLYVGDNRVLTRNTPSNTITTDVSKAGFVTSGTNKLITITVPESAALDSTKISIEVAVDGGLFKIKYVEDAEEGSNAAINNAAIIALKKAYATGGTMTKVGGLLGLNVVLYPEIFDTDFEHITDLEEWNAAVAMATKLGRTSETFKVDSIIDFNGEMAMPEGCAVTVEAATTLKSGVTDPTLNIKKSIESWPAGLTSEIAVVNHKTISNATGIKASSILNKGNMKAIADTIACPVVNEGTITLKALAKLSNVDNAKGRINVAYGSYVNLKDDTDAGVIAYTVASAEKAYKINYLIATGDAKHANVNTLVVKSGRTLDLNLTDPAGVGVNDPYNPTSGAAATPLASLANINIELNEGILVADANSEKTVKNVEVLGGENNEIKNVNIVEDLTVTKGKVTVDAEVAYDYKTAATIANIDVKKDAELISNVDIYVTNIANPSGAKTTVAEPYTIWYTNVYTQGGSATGSILKASWDGVADQVVPTTEGRLTVYTVNKADELVWLSQQGQLKNTKVVLGGNINMAGVNWTKGINFGAGDFQSHLDGNGFAIMNLNGNSGLLSYAVGSIKNLTIEGVNIASNDFIGALANNSYALIENVTVKNVTVKGTKRVGAIVGIHNGGNMKNCHVENASISGDCYSAGVITGMVNESAGQKFESCTIKNSTVDAELKGAIAGIINGVTLTVQNITIENTTPSELVGKLYNGGKLVEVK